MLSPVPMTQTPVGIELDREISEKIFGLSTKPSRELAIARVVWSKIIIAGNPMEFDDGRKFPIPPGNTLPQPQGSDYFNDRYALFIGKQILPEIEAEVEAYRTTPPRYSTEITSAWEIVNILRPKYQGLVLVSGGSNWHCQFGVDPMAEGQTAQEAICRAALVTLLPTIGPVHHV